MPSRKRKRVTRGKSTSRPSPVAAWPAGGEREQARERRREERFRAREAAARRRRRAATLRRVRTWGIVGVVVIAAALYFGLQARQRGKILEDAAAAAAQAGCTEIASRPDRGATHTGEPVSYQERPATSGPHGTPLPPEPKVHQAPVQEENAVHNLEHGYVLVYFRQDGPAALRGDTVQALSVLSSAEGKVIMAPYEQLEERQALALVAWNRLQQCPSTISPTLATQVARGFIARFRGGGEAPEPNAQ